MAYSFTNVPQHAPFFVGAAAQTKRHSGTIGAIKWQRNGVNLEVATDQPSKLTFAETNYPGWHVRINGVATAIDSRWPHFMSVTVPSGTSTLQWSYHPWWLIPGICCWLLGAVMLDCYEAVYAYENGADLRIPILCTMPK
jgi:uncharacterized membrane protein YfhO